MVGSATTRTQAVVSEVAVLPPLAATSAATVTATVPAVVSTTAPRVATFATSSPALNNALNPVSMPAKKVAVLTPLVATTVAVTALNSVLHPHTLGTRATAVQPHAKMAHVKLVAGKSGVVTTAMQPGQPHAALLAINLPVVLSPSAPATSSLTQPQAKALQSAVAHAC